MLWAHPTAHPAKRPQPDLIHIKLPALSGPLPQGTHERYRGRCDPSHLGPVERYFMEVGQGVLLELTSAPAL